MIPPTARRPPKKNEKPFIYIAFAIPGGFHYGLDVRLDGNITNTL